MHRLIVVLAVISSVLAQTYSVQGPPDYSVRCNQTLELFNNDPAVVACAQMESYFSNAVNTYRTNTSALISSVNIACSPTSPEQACTADVVSRISTGINSDCAYELQNSDPLSAINRYARSLTFSGVYQQTLCATNNASGFCVADFLASYTGWPSTFSIMVGTKLDLFAAAAGNLTPTLSNISAFYLCTACSIREYSYVFAFVENILRNSSTLSTTQVGLPVGAISPDVQTILNYINEMNTTVSGICHTPFLTYSVAVPPPPTANHTSTVKPTSKSATSASSSATDSSDANATGTTTTSATTTTHSAASGMRSTFSVTLLAGVMAILAAKVL